MKLNRLDGPYWCWSPHFCGSCKYLNEMKEEKAGIETCLYFPDGIPLEIWRDESGDLCPCDKFVEDDTIEEYDDDLPELIEDL